MKCRTPNWKSAIWRRRTSGDAAFRKTIREERLKYLTDEKHIKAVTVLFSDLEGRLHMLDYDKKFIVKSDDNLTFDGSSIRGFTASERAIFGWESIGVLSIGCRQTISGPAKCWYLAR